MAPKMLKARNSDLGLVLVAYKPDDSAQRRVKLVIRCGKSFLGS